MHYNSIVQNIERGKSVKYIHPHEEHKSKTILKEN